MVFGSAFSPGANLAFSYASFLDSFGAPPSGPTPIPNSFGNPGGPVGIAALTVASGSPPEPFPSSF